MQPFYYNLSTKPAVKLHNPYNASIKTP